MKEPIAPSSGNTWSALAFDRRALATLLAAAIAGAVVALGASFLVPREYSASVTLLPAKAEHTTRTGGLAGQFGGLAALAGIELGNDDNRSESIATLRSRSLAVAFIEQERLMPELFRSKWNEATERWRVRDPEDVPTLGDAYRRFDRDIRSVAEDRRTGIVTLTITWRDRLLAAQWANELVNRVNREMRERAIKEARSSLDYLNRELEKTQVVELRQPIYQLIESRTNTVMLANVREQYAFRIIDPALPPDVDDYSRPLHWLFALAGAALGALAGLVVAWRRLAKTHDAG